MKKRTDEEKLQMIDEACTMLNEAAKMIRNAKWNLHLCGIECCNGFNEKEIEDWECFASNVQVYSGIKKLEKITETKAYFENDYITEKPDKSRLLLNYKNLLFLQVGNEVTSKTANFKFK